MDDGKIALIDFGMVGHLSNDIQNALIDGLIATSKGDVGQYVEILRDLDIRDRLRYTIGNFITT